MRIIRVLLWRTANGAEHPDPGCVLPPAHAGLPDLLAAITSLWITGNIAGAGDLTYDGAIPSVTAPRRRGCPGFVQAADRRGTDQRHRFDHYRTAARPARAAHRQWLGRLPACARGHRDVGVRGAVGPVARDLAGGRGFGRRDHRRVGDPAGRGSALAGDVRGPAQPLSRALGCGSRAGAGRGATTAVVSAPAMSGTGRGGTCEDRRRM
jgi:hypothetical protein